jgi:Zn-dependent alcohol dehydrogenase
VTEVRAAVLVPGAAELVVLPVHLDPPGVGEVRVRVEVAGACHSDYHYMSGDLSCPLPAVLGHEGAGVVEEIGPGVAALRPGDHVLFLWRAGCGACAYCAGGRPALCGAGQQARLTGTLPSGTMRWRFEQGPIHHFLGVSCFAEQTVCDQRSLLKIDPDLPLTQAALAGCALMSGVGAVVNTARLRPGDCALIIGAGGIGISAVMGAALAGARRIIAADISTARLDLAGRIGATDTIAIESDADLVDQLHALEPDGVDHAFEMIGRPTTIAAALACLRRGGVATVVGLAPQGATAHIDALDLVLGEKRLQGSMYGSSRPHRDFPILFELVRRGLLPVDDLVSASFPLDGIGDAFHHMLTGSGGRAIVLPQPV